MPAKNKQSWASCLKLVSSYILPKTMRTFCSFSKLFKPGFKQRSPECYDVYSDVPIHVFRITMVDLYILVLFDFVNYSL